MAFKGLARLWGGVLIITALLAVPGCDSPNGPGIARSDLDDVFPADGATDQSLNVTLQWAFSGDSLKASVYYYNVFFGTQSRPPLVADSLYDDQFTPGALDPQTVYFWQVQAYRDTVMVASSPVMHFKTGRSFTYPLAVGLRWDYWHETYSYTSDGQPNPYYRDTGRATIEITELLTIYDTIDVYDLHIHESIGAEYHSCDFYINNTDDGLYTYGYTDPSTIAPRRKFGRPGITLTFAGRTFDSPARLFAFIRDGISSADKGDPYPPPEPQAVTESYAYPLRIGHQWTYRSVTDEGVPFRIDKKIIGHELVTVPAGVFDCFVIQWFWDINDDGRWEDGIDGYDYLAPQGLIKREFFVGKVGTGQAYDNPEEIEYYDFYDGYTLTDYCRELDQVDGVPR